MFGRFLVALALVALPHAAWALPLNVQVPSNAFITHAGLEWAWAAPCAPVQPSCGVIDLSFQSGFGWRLPTSTEILLHPNATDFMFPGANVPFGGSDANGAHFQDLRSSLTGNAACAAPYFSTFHTHCDWGNGFDGLWAGLPGTESFWETLVVNGNANDLNAVPEPSTFLLLGSSLAALGGAAWRRVRQK